MGVPEELKHDEDEVNSIIKQERDIQGHIDQVSKRLEKLENMEKKAEKYKEKGQDTKAEKLEEEIANLNRQILDKDFEQIVRQIRKGEEETGQILSNMPVEEIDVGEMKRLPEIAQVIEEHFKPKQDLGNPESNLYSSGEPEIAPNPEAQRGNNNYPSQRVSNKYDEMQGRNLQEEEVIVLQKLNAGTHWYNYPGSIHEMEVLGDEIIEDLKLAKNEIEELEHEVEEDEEVVERAKRTSDDENVKKEEQSEENDLREAEEAINEMRSKLEELIEHHQKEQERLSEYKSHLGEFSEAAQESLRFVESVMSYIEKFRESSRRDEDLEKHIKKIMAQNPDSLAEELETAIEYSEKAQKRGQ